MENSQFQNPDNAGVLFVDAPEYYLSDYLLPENISPAAEQHCWPKTMVPTESVGSGSSNPIPTSSNMANNGTKKKVQRAKCRIAFRIKTELETLDDGFKWRKYGKKMVKTSPNPRNYYKCSSGGCSVKKRVERDREDSRYIIATYEGVHNHESPCVLYYTNEMYTTLPIEAHGWALQPSSLPSSSL
ncbi:PREDICTED: probable WRKY transcription factor 51 [Ipomoea nil]|uniref:probable WRKY transcription factor 51 n=1 Tax=Ipomoea nil TaxID=35883 RepID=UPI000901D299|nr:PREDICTED: probable WRKY transcription factor 51 [Ipomoea nil]